MPMDQSRKNTPRAGTRFAAWGESLVEWAIRLCGWERDPVRVRHLPVQFSARPAPILFGKFEPAGILGQQPAGSPNSEVHTEFGILAMLVGSVAVTLLAMLIAVPLGLGAAVYISEFCPGRLKEVLKS